MYEIIMDIGTEESQIATFRADTEAAKYWDRIIANAADLGLKSARLTIFNLATGVPIEETRKHARTMKEWPEAPVAP
jgi:hypothetical protein